MIVGWVLAIVLSIAALPSPPAEGAPNPDTGFIYLEPVRDKGTITYVVRWSGDHRPPDAGVRIERFIEKGGREEQFGAADGGTHTLREGWSDRFVPGQDETGRRWPLVFPDTPPPDAQALDYRVTLSFGDTVAVQRILLTPIDGQWRTASKRVKVPRVGAFTVPSTFREAQDQRGPAPVPNTPAQTDVDDDGDDDAAPAPDAPPEAISRSETAADLRAALGSREVAALALGLVVVAGVLYWIRRNRGRFGPSPEQRGMEGTGLLVMLVLVLVISGAMILHHFVER